MAGGEPQQRGQLLMLVSQFTKCDVAVSVETSQRPTAAATTTLVRPHSTHYLETRSGSGMALPTIMTSHGGEVGLEPTAPVFQACVDCGVGPNYLESIPSDI